MKKLMLFLIEFIDIVQWFGWGEFDGYLRDLMAFLERYVDGENLNLFTFPAETRITPPSTRRYLNAISTLITPVNLRTITNE